MTKRICMLRQSSFPTETHLRKNVDALADAGYQVDVICLRDPGQAPRQEYRGGSVHRLPLTRRRGGKLRYAFEYLAFFLMSGALLTYLTASRRYRIVEVYNLPDFLVFAALPARLLGAKLIFYMFELMPEQTADEYGLSVRHPLIRLLHWTERLAVRSAHRIITVSPYDESIVSSRTSPCTPPAVILNVPEEDLFSKTKAARRQESNGHFRVITHGSLLRRYGIQNLIRAVPLVVDEIPNVEVRILGAGEHRDELERLVDELGVRQHVRFLGWIPDESTVPRIVEQASVGVVAALLPRLLPNKLFEYVALDRPAIVAANPSVRMVFSGDEVAYYAPDRPSDLARRIIELHKSPERARRLAANARRVYERHKWSRSRQLYVRIHDDLLPATSARTTPSKETA